MVEAMATEIVYQPIGTFQSPQVHPFDAGRQPDSSHAKGVIHLSPGQNFEQALLGLEGFSHIWVIFQFHHNTHWHPMVSPPRGSASKQGVFATRAPYRPNNIGLSVVRLESISGLKISVAEADLLDGSPILDIKPYLKYVDARTDATDGWIREEPKLQISFTEKAQEQFVFLSELVPTLAGNLKGFLQHQLEYDPINTKKKRVRALEGGLYEIAYRTWRAQFVFSTENSSLQILNFTSGYSSTDLASSEDPHADKEAHRKFLKFRPKT